MRRGFLMRDSEDISTYGVLGIPIAATDLERAAAKISYWKDDSIGRSVGVRDVASLMALRSDPFLRDVSRRTAMNVPDGMPLVLLGKCHGLPVARTCGPDLMEKVLLESPSTGLKHFFLGGKEGVAEKLSERFRGRNPEISIVGTYCPPFRPLTSEEDSMVVKMIIDSGADVVWVGISSPKQDIWMDEHLDSLPVTMIGVGAAFDFHSGEVLRAPNWMQRAGIEWLHRLASEPKRLWRRYLVLAPKFIILVIWEAVFRRLKPRVRGVGK